MTDSPADQVLVRSTIEMAHALNQIVVAEGIETDEVMAMLADMGCDQAQGYLIGEPMSIGAIVDLLAENKRAAA